MSTTKTRPMQHIDRKSLYTDLESRIRYLHSFLDFGASDIEALRSGSRYIQALTPAVVNIVYRKLLQYDITARAFQTRSTAFEGPMDSDPDETSPQILHRKSFLRAYLKKLCSDPTQMEFWEYLDKVGMMHTGLGRSRPLHIEYIHIGATLAVIQDVLSEAILSHPRLPLARRIAIVKALGKVVWIQNDLFARWYVTDGEEFTDGVDYASRLAEKEGYLHGKRVLTPDQEEDAAAAAAAAAAEGKEQDGAKEQAEKEKSPGQQGQGQRGEEAKAGVCPFGGMVSGMEGLKLQNGVQDGQAGVDGAVPKTVGVGVNEE
ncbi:globin-like-protein [Thermothelomyces heterothallicus CBS 202.75]|uniref:globin-like-protein n=1 Tax=Thermothelomyces heterothallicus CBS 202.75 TaxID=1149848 RepID=UPI003741FAA8